MTGGTTRMCNKLITTTIISSFLLHFGRIGCERTRWEKDDPRVELEELNDLSSNYKIASLSQIVRQKFPGKYLGDVDQQLTHVLYMKVHYDCSFKFLIVN